MALKKLARGMVLIATLKEREFDSWGGGDQTHFLPDPFYKKLPD